MDENIQDNQKLKSFHVDAIKEIATIGMGNATTSLSNMIGKRVKLNLANVYTLDIRQMATSIPESITMVGIISRLKGDIDGFSLMLMDVNNAILLRDVVLDNVEDEDFTYSESSINETTNILIGSYFNAVSQFLGINVTHSSPYSVSGTIFNVLENLIEFSNDNDDGLIDNDTLVLETMFMVESVSGSSGLNTLYSDMFLFLNNESKESLINSLDQILMS
ncbi:chemotaxis protein CheC [Methanosalsum natronophilum]|uniref:Uncharacterized protein n=1 Tax=Methanosalsum natronophilum TaxID=768733 RepID=A0A424YV55_9EURY|nr:chemotaxis protein CheC [Methanosalsum natronophilum]MCS3922974.1 chemotaxis protein CheC [Methanosalsum natronophilum]RQD83078.1 MAG: hypothetical protein D5R95_06480 [Methanosalsum natronophilum]